MRRALYTTITEALKANTNIVHTDLWNNQVALAEEEQPFYTPAAFVEFGTIDWQHHLHGAKEAVIQLRLHVVTDSRVSLWSETIEVFELLDEINRALHGLHATMPDGSIMDALTLTQSITDHDFDELQDNIEVYECHVTDKSACS